MNLVCMRHSQYDGTQPPTLSCKNCCGIFIAEIKRRSQASQGEFDAYKWLEDKAREVRPSQTKAKAQQK